MQDIPQIEAFKIPGYVELTKFTGVDFNFVQNCVGKTA